MLSKFINYLFGGVDSNDDKRDDLGDRMNRYTQSCQLYTEYFTPFIVSIQSKDILDGINTVTNLDEKIKQMKTINDLLYQVCKSVYNRFDPTLVYYFNNEIHVLFNGNSELLYNGDIYKLITILTSFVTKEFQGNCMFTAKYTEFPKDYECLNYLVWRQFDCKRNNVTLLYKCLHKDLYLDSALGCDQKLDDMFAELPELPLFLTLGNILKKNLVYHEKKGVVYHRKLIEVMHINLAENFSQNFKTLVCNKIK